MSLGRTSRQTSQTPLLRSSYASDYHDLHEGEDEDEDEGNIDVSQSFEREHVTRVPAGRAFVVRAVALLCACSLSVGSHYASYILGPLKSRISKEMGTDNTEFSLLIAAFSLNSTWTPLVGGLMASRLGTTYTSILATGVIFLGQALLLFGDLTGSVRFMAFGMFVFGLGVSPLAVVQETIIVRFFRSHGLGVSMALGLVAGKGASFISARTSFPLSQHFGPHAPFYAATGLAGLSVVVNLIYIVVSKWLIDESGAELEAVDFQDEARRRVSFSEAEALQKVAEKRKVSLKDTLKLGDVFWAYIGLNVLCGALWSPFTHLSANIIERRYGETERDASRNASYLLAGSVFLYPFIGVIVDRLQRHAIVIRLFMLSSALTMLCYIWLALPVSWTHTPIPAIVSFAIGHGFSPLLLVVIVPQLVSHKYISTTLGAHKSLEQTGSTIFQTLAGLALDTKNKENPSSPLGDRTAIQYLINAWLVLNVLQFAVIQALHFLERRRARILAAAAVAEFAGDVSEPDSDSEPPKPIRHASSNLSAPGSRHASVSPDRRAVPPASANRVTRKIRRGKVFAVLCAALVAFAWVLFMTTAWVRLRSKKERQGGTS
ncbi:hypothetical protein PLICRDRAFT_36635 [Plicaturopsis crispa FD-325 SS-3]|nr:hypothetical protein PLICRDRAFT_36635 [Plicaturopsis crispa FD-325 SS-3]